MIILEWSLLTKGQEFKGFIKGLRNKPDIICIEETCLKPTLDFGIKDYCSIHREGSGGRCIIPVK